jgi:hypothetical protein
MMVPLGIEHPLCQALLQLVNQTSGFEHRRRISSLQKLVQHLIRDSFSPVRRHTLPPALSGFFVCLTNTKFPTPSDEQVAELIKLVVQRKPAHATHWSVRSAAAVSRIPKRTVGRYFTLFGLPPHRSKSFKLSTDPCFVEKVRDIVGR